MALDIMSESEITLQPIEEELLVKVHSWLNDPVAFGDFDQPHPIEWVDFRARWQGGLYKSTKIIFQAGEPVGWVRHFIADKRPWICAISIFITLPKMRGQGIGARAMLILMNEILKEAPEICKFEVMTDINNKAAQAMFQKIGFTQEGLFQRYWKLKGQFSDMYSYALLV